MSKITNETLKDIVVRCGGYALSSDRKISVLDLVNAYSQSLARIAELEAEVKKLGIASTELIGYIKSGNNAKAYLQMLALEAMIDESAHLTAVRDARSKADAKGAK